MKQPPSLPRSICLGFGFSGIVAYVIMAWIDLSLGRHVSVSNDGRDIIPAAMLFVSGFGFFCAAAAGSLFRSSRYVWAVILFIVTGGYMSYTALNGVGFFAGETVSKTRATIAQNKAVKEATDKANDRSQKLIEDTMGWLKSTQVRTAKERERIEDKVIELATKPIEVKPVNTDAIIADARAEVMSSLTGWKTEASQLANSVWVVALLVIGKLLGPAVLFGGWPQPKVGGKLQDESASIPEENDEIWTLSSKSMSKQESLSDLRQIFPSKTHPLTLSYLTARWGLTSEGARQRLKDWERNNLITLGKTQGKTGPVIYVKSVKPVLVSSNNDLKASA